MRLIRILSALWLAAAVLAAAGCSEKDTSQDNSAGQTPLPENQAGTAEEAPVRISGTILEVGTDTITVDNQSGQSYAGEIILTIDPESTRILDARTGLPLPLSDIPEGNFAAYLGPAMTMSMPPKATPLVVIANAADDGSCPLYAEAAEDAVLTDHVYVLETTDGSAFRIPEDVDIQSYRAKNIVTPEDITRGRSCVIWQDDQGNVTKIVLFED